MFSTVRAVNPKYVKNQIKVLASDSQVLGCNWKYLHKQLCEVNWTPNSSSSTLSTCPLLFSCGTLQFFQSRSSIWSAACKGICGLWCTRDYKQAFLSSDLHCGCPSLVGTGFHGPKAPLPEGSCSSCAGSLLVHVAAKEPDLTPTPLKPPREQPFLKCKNILQFSNVSCAEEVIRNNRPV